MKSVAQTPQVIIRFTPEPETALRRFRNKSSEGLRLAGAAHKSAIAIFPSGRYSPDNRNTRCPFRKTGNDSGKSPE
jgi:hypothetical protein